MAEAQTKEYRWVKKRSEYVLEISEGLGFIFGSYYAGDHYKRVYYLVSISQKRVDAGIHFYQKKGNLIEVDGDPSSIFSNRDKIKEAIGLDDDLKKSLVSLLEAAEKEKRSLLK